MSHLGNQIYIQDVSIVCALGRSHEELLKRLNAGSQIGMIEREGLYREKSLPFGTVVGDLPNMSTWPIGQRSRNNQLIQAAVDGFADSLQRVIERYGPHRIAVVLSTSTSGIKEGEETIAQLKREGRMTDSYHYHQQEISNGADFLASRLGLLGPALTISTACSSGAKALGSARGLLALGVCDAVVVGGADTLSKMTVEGFGALGALSGGLCNPFSAKRDGITIGEGAALFILSKEEAAVAILGVGERQDAYHFSAPDPSGRGATGALNAALAEAKLNASDIDYVNLHGTGTAQNDAMESLVVSSLFGDSTPCSSTKPITGHTLGVSGAIELGLCWLSLTQETGRILLPPHVWTRDWDPSLPAIKLTKPGDSITLASGTTYMSNSFAFGGSNASVIIGRC